MNELPLNAVENTRGEASKNLDSHSNFAKSPVKFSVSEKRVIGGLKQLTELLFQQHYKNNTDETDSNQDENMPVQSDEISMYRTAETVPEKQCVNMDMNMDLPKENDGNFQQFLDSAMKDGAEQFCAMVVQQLTNQQHVEQHDEWHRGQLNAYNLAHQRLFENNE